MFKKRERLTRAEFSDYFATGRRYHGPYTTIIYLPHPTRKTAVVVGKKVAKHAVKRNTLRRRVYAVLRQVLDAAGVTGVFIVLVKPAITNLPRTQAAAAVAAALHEVIAAHQETP